MIRIRKTFKCQCGETDPTKFYGHKRQICGKCHNIYTLNRGRENRQRAINYLGGECKICGYKKYLGALDLHHLDPTIKDEKFCQMRGWSWERTLREIQNCVVLCRCCHVEVHAGITQL